MKNLPRGLTYDVKRRQFRVQFTSQHTAPGERYREQLPKGTRRKDAEAYLAKLQNDDRMGALEWPAAKRLRIEQEQPWTVGTFAVEQYLPYCSSRNKASTLERKKRALKRLAPWFWDELLEDVDDVAIEQFATERKCDGVRDRTVNLEVGELRHLLNVAWKKKIRTYPAPFYGRLPENDKKPPHVFTADGFERALRNATEKGFVFRVLTLFLRYMGTRWTETRNLRRDRVDWETGRIVLDSTETKTSKSRIVQAPTGLLQEMRLLPELGEFVFMHEHRGEAYPMPRDARFGSGKNLFYPWQGRDRDFQHGPHSFRHTFATECLRSGSVGLKQLSVWLGHASVKVTADLYGHITPLDAAEQITGLYPEHPILQLVANGPEEKI